MSKKLRVGSKLIENGKVCRVFKISKRVVDGEHKLIIHYRPFYKDETNKTVLCSIPRENLETANIRRPLPKPDIDKVLVSLRKKIRLRKPIDIDEAKEKVKLNDIKKTASVFKTFWKAKKKDGETFTKSKQDLMNIALESFVEEIALVKELSLTHAKELVIESVDQS